MRTAISTLVLAAALAPVALIAGGARAQFSTTNAFTYQGVLENSGTAVTGPIAVRYSLFSSSVGGTAIQTRTVNNVQADRGLFNIDIDLPLSTYADASQLFIDIEVQSPSGVGAFTRLTPRQRLGASPFALNTRGIRVDANNRVAMGPLTSIAPLLSSLNLSPSGGDARALGFTNAAGSDRWAFAIPDGNLRIFAPNTPASSHVFEANSGNVAFGDSASQNPSGFSRAVSITGQSSGSFPGSAAYVVKNSVTGSVWSMGVLSNGAFSFIHNGVGGQSIVSVPVLQITGGSDVAEPYDVAPAGEIAPTAGMVVSIDPDRLGKLRVADSAYDRKVAGIISGANGVAPGLTLTQPGTAADGELPVAKLGRVWCLVDADAAGPIVAGDQLTTSSTPGHAMKADPTKASGCVLGKAMSSLEKGKGMVLVLVTLQ